MAYLCVFCHFQFLVVKLEVTFKMHVSYRSIYHLISLFDELCWHLGVGAYCLSCACMACFRQIVYNWLYV